MQMYENYIKASQAKGDKADNSQTLFNDSFKGWATRLRIGESNRANQRIWLTAGRGWSEPKFQDGFISAAFKLYGENIE